MEEQRSRWTWFRWVKWLIGAVVFVGLVIVLASIVRDLQASKLDFREIRWGWLAAAYVLYMVGTVPGGVFWHLVLNALGQRSPLNRSLRAFFFSQLGKYVPGKAMVVVMRTMMVAGPGMSTPIAVTSVFIETLTWMAVGAMIGSLMVAILNPQHTVLMVVGVLGAFAVLVLISPPVLGWTLKRAATIKGNTSGLADLRGLNSLTMVQGWVLMAVGWTFVAASFWAVLRALPGPEATLAHFALAMECVTLSIVVGIVSLIPGGLGVRELVMVPLLSRDFGAPKALACAIVVRLIWLISELSVVGIIHWSGKIRARSVISANRIH